MKYSMVKQFSNAAIDNAFSFVFKIVDFLKDQFPLEQQLPIVTYEALVTEKDEAI